MASPEHETILQALRSRPQPENPTIEEQRAGMKAVTSLFQLAEDVSSEAIDAGGVPAEWISTPEGIDGRVVLYLHGGGYCIGSIDAYREMISRLARASGARVLAVDYRQAPEDQFPAAVDDATAAYRWLIANGVDPTQLVIAGDSAGGGLTVATLVALRDGGDPLPAAASVVSPWADLGCTGESIVSRAEIDPLLQPDGLSKWASFYLGDADPQTPLASPINADLAGLPPLLVLVGTAEILYDDATRLAERAKEVGVDVTLEPWDEMFHIWPLFSPMLPEGRQAIERIGEFVKGRVG